MCAFFNHLSQRKTIQTVSDPKSMKLEKKTILKRTKYTNK